MNFNNRTNNDALVQSAFFLCFFLSFFSFFFLFFIFHLDWLRRDLVKFRSLFDECKSHGFFFLRFSVFYMRDMHGIDSFWALLVYKTLEIGTPF